MCVCMCHAVEQEERVLPDSGQDGSSLTGSGEQEKGPVNPWDIFASTVENLSTSSLEGTTRLWQRAITFLVALLLDFGPYCMC